MLSLRQQRWWCCLRIRTWDLASQGRLYPWLDGTHQFAGRLVRAREKQSCGVQWLQSFSPPDPARLGPWSQRRMSTALTR
jgi:hypothetical protein